MRGKVNDRNIYVMWAGALLLGVAYGVALSLTPLHLKELKFSEQSIGTLASWFALGIVLLSVPTGAIVKKTSARGMILVCLLGYAASVIIFPYLRGYPQIAAARFMDGAFSVGVWNSTETILLSRSEKDNKAFIMSVYALMIAIGYVIGPIAAKGFITFIPMHYAFIFSGVTSVAAVVLLILKLDKDKADTHEGGPGHEGEQWYRLLWWIKTSCFGTFAYGYFQSTAVAFLTLFFMDKKGIAKDKAILLQAFFAGGMLLFSSFAGRIGDRSGHLKVMRGLAALGLMMVAAMIFIESYPLMCVASFIAGACLASISPVSLALQGIIVPARDLARANAIYNTFFAGGMLLGPTVSGVIYTSKGGAAMLAHLVGIWIAFVLFTIVFFKDDPRARGVAAPPAPAGEAPPASH
jgi:MFS family permease